MRKRVCGINPCQLNLISYCSLFCIEHLEWMAYFSSIAVLFHFFPKTVTLSHVLCGSTLLSICSHSNDSGGVSQEECLNLWEMGEQICLTTPLIKQQMAV